MTGEVGRLRLLHSTLVPGRSFGADGLPTNAGSSLRAHGFRAGAPINEQLRVEVAYSITGRVAVPEHAAGLWLLDSIVDGLGGAAVRGPLRAGVERLACPLVVERSTLLGRTRARSLDARDSIFDGEVLCGRVQTGAVRSSFVPPGSHTPRRIRCQPDLAVAAAIRERERRAPAPTQPELDAIRASIEACALAVVHLAPLRRARLRAAADRRARRDRDRRRGRLRAGRVLPPEAAAAREQPARPARRVPAVRARARADLRDLRRRR